MTLICLRDIAEVTNRQLLSSHTNAVEEDEHIDELQIMGNTLLNGLDLSDAALLDLMYEKQVPPTIVNFRRNGRALGDTLRRSMAD